MNTNVKRRKRRRYRINKIKFIRFIICCIMLIAIVTWLISIIVNAICNIVFKHDEVATMDTIGKIEAVEVININTRAYASSDEENASMIDYSIKPDGLDNTYFKWIVEISENEEVPLEVILAIITTENETYNVNSTNKNSNGTIDMGLCQINSAYIDYFAKTYNIENLDPYNVYDAVTFVARHMKYLSEYAIDKYDLSEIDSYTFAAGAYNRGLTNECKYRNMYHYKEKFLTNYNKFI